MTLTDVEQLERVIARALATDAPSVTDAQVRQYPALAAAGYGAVCAPEYDAIPFMASLAAQYAQRGSLTPAQLRAALNIAIGEARKARKPAASVSADVAAPFIDLRSSKERATDDSAEALTVPVRGDTKPIPNGIYTVTLNDGRYRTIRLKAAPEGFKAPAGAQIAEYLSGPDNEASYTGFATLIGEEYRVWARYSADSAIIEALANLIADPMGAAQARVRASGKCFVCNRTLTTPDSLALGIGPICLSKLQAAGWSWAATDVRPHATRPAIGPRDGETKAEYSARVKAEMDELFN